MVLCLFIYFLAVHFDWSIILIRKSFGASRHILGKLGVKLAIVERPAVSWGVLGCPGVIRPTLFVLSM